ncbi:MAG: hypothetical protein OEX81_02910 [Candidatus Pacebacteria bacterium]|nr:hypothetical protein [Candidatus Paceibacterota bacterium]
MQRGILEITKPVAQTAINLLANSTQDLSQLFSRLTMVIQGNEELSTIEVDREEVEALLDAMPIPNENEDINYKLLRNILTMFLAKKSS